MSNWCKALKSKSGSSQHTHLTVNRDSFLLVNACIKGKETFPDKYWRYLN